MDGKTGRPIISLKFKTPPPGPDAARAPAPPRRDAAERPVGAEARPVAPTKPAPQRRPALREVILTKPAPKAEPVIEESKASPPIEPAAMRAASSVVADPAWQSAELQKSYQEAKSHARPIHRKQAKLVSGIVMRRVASDLPEESETRGLAMRAAYAAAFASLIDSAQASV